MTIHFGTDVPLANGSAVMPKLGADFAAKLSEAISEALTRLGVDSSALDITVDGAPGAAGSPSAPARTGGTPVSLPSPFSQPVIPQAVSTPDKTETAPAAPSQHWYASTPEDDAYWAKQPPEVRQLREIRDPDKRMQLGLDLAHKGFLIDMPVMIWGWDAGQTTAERKAYGYKWVPSMLQQPVSALPGIRGPFTPYDPDNPPPGSILV